MFSALNIMLAVSWLRRLVVGLTLRRPVFAPRSIHVGFVVNKVALGHVFVRVLRFYPVNIIPLWLSTGYGLDDRAIDIRSSAEARGFFL
jgi:hypothetical protein